MEKEVALSDLESQVLELERRAAEAKREKELRDWEEELKQRELRARRRMEEAQRIIRENSLAGLLSPGQLSESGSSELTSLVIPRSNCSPTSSIGVLSSASPEGCAAWPSCSPGPPGPLASTPVPGPQLFSPGPARAILLPPGARLPASAIRLTFSPATASGTSLAPQPQSGLRASAVHLTPISTASPLTLTPTSHALNTLRPSAFRLAAPNTATAVLATCQNLPINLSKPKPGQQPDPTSNGSSVNLRIQEARSLETQGARSGESQGDSCADSQEASTDSINSPPRPRPPAGSPKSCSEDVTATSQPAKQKSDPRVRQDCSQETLTSQGAQQMVCSPTSRLTNPLTSPRETQASLPSRVTTNQEESRPCHLLHIPPVEKGNAAPTTSPQIPGSSQCAPLTRVTVTRNSVLDLPLDVVQAEVTAAAPLPGAALEAELQLPDSCNLEQLLESNGGNIFMLATEETDGSVTLSPHLSPENVQASSSSQQVQSIESELQSVKRNLREMEEKETESENEEEVRYYEDKLKELAENDLFKETEGITEDCVINTLDVENTALNDNGGTDGEIISQQMVTTEVEDISPLPPAATKRKRSELGSSSNSYSEAQKKKRLRQSLSGKEWKPKPEENIKLSRKVAAIGKNPSSSCAERVMVKRKSARVQSRQGEGREGPPPRVGRLDGEGGAGPGAGLGRGRRRTGSQLGGVKPSRPRGRPPSQRNLINHLESMKESQPKTVAPSPVKKIDFKGKPARLAATKAKGRVAEFVRQIKTRSGIENSDSDTPETTEDSDDNFEVKDEIKMDHLYEILREKKKKKKRFRCRICSQIFTSQEYVQNHIVKNHHSELDEGIIFKERTNILYLMIFCSDDDFDEDEESSDSEIEEEEDDDEVLESSLGGAGRGKKRRSDGPGSAPRKLLLEPSKEFVKAEAVYRREHYGQNSYPELVPDSAWQPDAVPGPTLPGTTSVQFRLEGEASSISLESGRGAVLAGGSRVFFCEGPVLSLAWCPGLPPDHDQVLAASVKLTWAASQYKDSGPGPGLIQLWRLRGPEAAPSLVCSLAHNGAAARGLAWLPSGGLNAARLGLLAAACQDGKVRVWAVPTLASLMAGTRYSREAELVLCGAGTGALLAISWYRGPGHRFLAASSTSGLIAVWDLTASSPLLRTGRQLRPVQTWLAGTGSVTAVSICPGPHQQPSLVITGGTDRCFRVWDPQQPAIPLVEMKKGCVTDVAWLADKVAVVGYDDVYLQGHTQVLLAELGGSGQPARCQPAISQNSAVTKLVVSPWLGCLASATAAGELVVFISPSLHRSVEHDKNLVQRRCFVFRTEVEQLEGGAGGGDPRQYRAARARAGLVWRDTDLQRAARSGQVCAAEEVRRVRSAERMAGEQLEAFPLSSLTSLDWCDSPGNVGLLAAGGGAGLVRIHNLLHLVTPAIRAALPDK